MILEILCIYVHIYIFMLQSMYGTYTYVYTNSHLYVIRIILKYFLSSILCIRVLSAKVGKQSSVESKSQRSTIRLFDPVTHYLCDIEQLI